LGLEVLERGDRGLGCGMFPGVCCRRKGRDGRGVLREPLGVDEKVGGDRG